MILNYQSAKRILGIGTQGDSWNTCDNNVNVESNNHDYDSWKVTKHDNKCVIDEDCRFK